MHPFRYYGTRPRDWFDYGYVLVRFAATPDDGAKKAIGGIVDGAHLPGKRQRWKGRILSIFMDGVESQLTFDRLRDALVEAHAVAAIDEVVNHLARSGSDEDWETWSLEQAGPDEDLYDPNDMSAWAYLDE